MLGKLVVFCFVALMVVGCGDDPSNGDGQDGGVGQDVNTDPIDAGDDDGAVIPPDGGSDATTPDPDGGPPACTPPTGLTRGQQWVRDNPVFISGLIPGMGAPSAANVAAYYDTFAANATHFWADGMPVNEAAWAAVGHPDYRFISWTQNDGTSPINSQVVGGNPDAPGRIGYQVGDEPEDLAGWNEIQVGVAAVRAADPDALIIVNFSTTQPSAGDLATMLAQAGASLDVDVLAYDLYTYTKGAFVPLELIRATALAHDKVYWRYINSYHTPGQDEPPSLNDMRWDAFVGVLYGYTGHSWFLYQVGAPHSTTLESDMFVTPGSYDVATTQHFTWASEINEQLAILGRTTSLLTSTDVRFVPSNSLLQPDSTSDWSPGAGGDPYITALDGSADLDELSVGFFTDDCGDIYIMVQNASHTHGNFPTVLDTAITVTMSFDFATVTDPNFDTASVESLNKLTGAVEVTPLTSTGATTADLSFTLDPGDVFFFKYRTANAFARQ